MEKQTLTTQEKDEEYGYRDRLVGFYDKWYRYNRKDEGLAYNEGFMKGDKNPNAPIFWRFIEVN